MNTEQFDRVIEAILDGKYSWACVLFLCSAGHNPLQYMPYRTYHRLMKENRQPGEVGYGNSVTKPIADLNYLDQMDASHMSIKGGWRHLLPYRVWTQLQY